MPETSRVWGRVVTLALATALLSTSALAAPRVHPVRRPSPHDTLSMAIVPRLDPTPTIFDILAAYDLAQIAGVTGTVVAYPWSTLEKSPGQYDLTDLVNQATYSNASRGMTLLLEIQVINTNVRETPADLASDSFDDPAVEARFHALIDALAPVLDMTTYLAIGNEVDSYLSAHPDQWASYTRFYENALAYVHSVAPNVKVGVTTTFVGDDAGAIANTETLNAKSDVFIMTYYPLGSGFQTNPPSVAASDIETMLGFAGSKPLVLQEVGYPTSTLLGSTEEAQAEFMQNVFEEWRRHPWRIPFLSIFALHDLTPDLCQSAAQYYGAPDDQNLQAFLCSLGLRRANGDPKPAWTVVQQEGTNLK